MKIVKRKYNSKSYTTENKKEENKGDSSGDKKDEEVKKDTDYDVDSGSSGSSGSSSGGTSSVVTSAPSTSSTKREDNEDYENDEDSKSVNAAKRDGSDGDDTNGDEENLTDDSGDEMDEEKTPISTTMSQDDVKITHMADSLASVQAKIEQMKKMSNVTGGVEDVPIIVVLLPPEDDPSPEPVAKSEQLDFKLNEKRLKKRKPSKTSQIKLE
ncbi:DNA polymerase V-like [Tetranychus urticae]|uniref:DNA polymerase V-like n=1 Tax=Tetranychus urticae TaxID=32264 RepID=UPI00077BEE53|nr:DNA polymerase V-like [Tetranychus urticae]